MKKRRIVWIIVFSVLLLIAAFLFWRFGNKPTIAIASPRPSPIDSRPTPASNPAQSGTPSSPGPPSDQVAQKEMLKNTFETPISFWGKVIDEEGKPVPNADVKFMAVDKPMSDQGTKYDTTSDTGGLFSISGIKGAGLYVQVAKEGYQGTEGSGRLFGYGIENPNKPPSANNPTVFILKKQGQAEPLKVFSSGGIRVPKNGQPVAVNLSQGHVTSSDQGDIQVEVWTQDQQKDIQGRYPWRCRITAPGGGFVERKKSDDFVAPSEGYKPTVEVSMDQTAARWQRDFDGEYFVKLKGGSFARITFNLTTGGDHFFMISSYLNPKPGSRNLEFDPAKAVKSP